MSESISHPVGGTVSGTSRSLIRRSMLPLVAWVLAGAAPLAFAGNLSFLNKTAAAKFSAEDRQLQTDAALALLKQGEVGESKDWSNPNTDAKGSIKVVKVFKSADGFACKSLRVKSSAKGRHGQATYPVCEIKPGDWQIHSAAKPAD